MNANSLNSYPATLVQGLLSPASQGAAHDDPLQPSISSRSRPASLFIPHAPNSRSTRPTSYPYPPTQQQSSTASSSYVSAATMASYSRPLPPQAFLDDPAFSSDPDENPHFSMSSLGDFLPVNSAALDVHASMRDNMYSPESAPIRDRSSLPPQHLRAHSAAYDPQFPPSVSPHHPRTRSHASALPPPRAPPSHDTWAFRPFDDPLDDFPYSEQALAPASRSFQDAKSRSHSESRSQPHYQPNVSPTSSASSSPITPPLSLESAPSSFSHSSYSHTSYSQSNYSHSSHSHSSHSDASHGSSKAAKMSTKKAPPAEPIVLLPPPAYSALPPPSDRPFPVTAVSAPEIRQASAATADVPPRSTSVPAPKAPAPPNPIARPSELRKQRSRRQSAAPPPGGLDKIDELDETDPLGFAWHHDSRYEGVKKLNEEADLKEEKDAATLLKEREQKEKDRAERKKHKKHAGVNPNTTSFSVSPGQIFPAFNPYHPQPTALPALQRLAPSSQAPTVPPPRSSPSPATLDLPPQPSRQASSSSLHAQLQAPAPSRQPSSQSLSAEMGHAMSQPPAPQPSRPPSIHSVHSTHSGHSQHSGSELPYTQMLPNPHAPNRAQTPPRHRLSRMAQDLVAAVPASITVPTFPNDPNFSAFSHASSATAQFGAGQSSSQGQSIYRASSSGSGSSGSSSRSRPPPPGLPPRLQQQQAMHSLPRPDIVLPPRHQAAKNRAQAAHQPHYLPKRLVMPAPLQPQAAPQQQQQMQGMLSYGSNSSISTGSSGDSAPPGMTGDYLTSSQLAVSITTPAQQAQQQAKKAKEIPMSHGRNLLRKRATVSGPPAAAQVDANVDEGVNVVNGVQVVGNGGGAAYVPSSNGSAAMFASKASVGSSAAHAHGSGSGHQGGGVPTVETGDARAAWERQTRERELQRQREKEWKREIAMETQAAGQREKEREKEKEKGGRKLSKRR